MVSTHEMLRELVGDLWSKYTRHEFVEKLRMVHYQWTSLDIT